MSGDGGEVTRRHTGDWWGVVCMIATGAALAATIPVVESGVNDDFSYSKTAFDLADTGRLVYNGWAAAMLGAQAYWGALFVKCFGASFLVLRLSTAVLAVWSAGLLYSLHRRAGLAPRLAAFGTLALTLSPLFVPNACTFMTDVPALFLFLLSVYGCARIAESLEPASLADCETKGRVPARAWAWVAFVVAVGILGGSVRQTNFILPVIGPGLIFWFFRNRIRCSTGVCVALGVSAAVTVTAAVGLTAWFHAQPFSIHEQLGAGLREFFRFQLKPVVLTLAKIGLTFAAVSFPLMTILPSFWRNGRSERPAVRRVAIGLASLVPIALLAVPDLSLKGSPWYFSWMGNTFTSEVFLTGGVPRPPGDIPLALPRPVFMVFSVAVLGLLSGSAAHAIVGGPGLSRVRKWSIWKSPVLLVWFAFGAVYLPLMLLKVFVPHSHGIWDRYLLPVVPLGTIWILTAYQRLGRERMPLSAWCALALLGAYGVMQTHDYFSQLRARLAITRHLEGIGIVRERIMGGFEYDGWTQITLAGHYNDPRIVNPARVYQPPPAPLPFKTIYRMWPYTPVVKPDYVVVLNPHPDLFNTDVPAQRYACWLPPFRREVAVQVTDVMLARTKALADHSPLTR